MLKLQLERVGERDELRQPLGSAREAALSLLSCALLPLTRARQLLGSSRASAEVAAESQHESKRRATSHQVWLTHDPWLGRASKVVCVLTLTRTVRRD